MEHTSLTLYELNSLVRDVIDTAFEHAYWVEADLSEAREVKGHLYMELVQTDLFSPTPIARASAKCWKSTWQMLRPKFESVTRQSLHAGMKVMLLVTANFHEAYGFSWIVQDIDPTYTMGDMARKRLEIIHQLKEQGVFDMQRELPIPMFAQRIAVISSAQAAGYGDFCNQLEDNEYGFKFYPKLFPATMQGDRVESSIIAALNEINCQIDHFDAVVIIRGGGATADLSGFDTLALAENVANFPLPIITGIGHDRDESIIDMVSNTQVKTPTAAAAFLIDHLARVNSILDNCQSSIINHAKNRLDREFSRLDNCARRIPTLFSLVKSRQENRINQLSNRLISQINSQLMQHQHQLQLISSNIKPLVEHLLEKQQLRLNSLTIRIKALDPELLLKRGYSITTHQGKIVKDATALSTGDEIVTRVQHGTLVSIVKKQS